MKIGRTLSQALPAVHTLSGCDHTCKLGKKHTALLVKPELYLRDFGLSKDNVDSLIDIAEAYLTQVLKKGTTLKTMDHLRSFKYHHAKQTSLEDLSPTSYSIRLHIKRAYLATYEVVSLFKSQESLDPRNFGFEFDAEFLVPSK